MNPNNLIFYVIIRLIDSSWFWRGKHTWQALIGNFFVAGSCRWMQTYELGSIQTSSYRCLNWPFTSHPGLCLSSSTIFFSNYHTLTIHFGFVYKYEISFALPMEIGEVAEVNILSTHL